jgi:YVTN family beta-propeller protein
MGRSLTHYVVLAAGACFLFAAAKSSCAADAELKKYFPKPIYISLQASDAIEVLPQRKILQGFPQAHYIALGPKGKILVVSGFNTGQVYVANAETGKKLATITVGSLVQGVKIDPSGQFALAVDTGGDSVVAIDLKSFKIVKTVVVGKSPHNVVFSRDGKVAYVTIQGANKVAVLDMSTLNKFNDIDIPELNGPHNLDLSNNGHWLWIRSHASPTQHGDVVLLDLASRHVLQTIPVGYFHGGIDNIPGSVVLTTDIGADTVEVIDRNALGIIKHIKVGAGPHGVRISPDGRWAYVASSGDNEVNVIDMRTLTVVQKIKTDGNFPFWIALVGND